MEFIETVYNKKTIEEHKAEAIKLRNKHPDRIPVIVDRARKDDPQLDKHKYLVPSDLTMGQFIMIIRKRLKEQLPPEKALFWFSDQNTMVPLSFLMSQIYKQYAGESQFLVLRYSTETTFGLKKKLKIKN